MPVRDAFLLERRRLIRRQIFKPVGALLHGARTNVDGQEYVGTELVDEVHEFVRAE